MELYCTKERERFFDNSEDGGIEIAEYHHDTKKS